MREIPDWLDNPLLVKHVRTQLRRSALMTPVAVVLVLTVLLLWWDVGRNAFPSGQLFVMNSLLGAIILLVMGAASVGRAVGDARTSGILDFHRISPLPPSQVALGFFLGAPIREWLLYGMTLPLSVLAVAASPEGPSWWDLVQVVAATVLLGLAWQIAAMLSALVSGKPTKSNGVGAIVVLLIVLFYGMGTILSGTLRWRMDSEVTDPEAIWSPLAAFFGLRLPWSVFLGLYAVPLVAFGLLACSRKVRSDREHVLSKPEVLGFVTLAGVLLLGGAWTLRDSLLALVYMMLLIGLAAAVVLAPRAGTHALGVRRAVHEGRRNLPFWHDLAISRGMLAVVCLVILGVLSLGRVCLPTDQIENSALSLAIAVAVLTVAYFGLAYQYFLLSAPARAGSYQFLLVFVVWIVPMLAGFVALVTGMPESVRTVLLAISPISGLAWSVASRQEFPGAQNDVVRMALLLPALLLPLVFNHLVLTQRRRIDREVREQVSRSQKADEVLEVVES